MLSHPTTEVAGLLERLNADGHVVIENLLPKAMVVDLRDRVERILAHERDIRSTPARARSRSTRSTTSISNIGAAATTRSNG